jgi:HEPN domain-containing protein
VKTKAEHIEYWISQSMDDVEAAELLYGGKKYLQASFFTHLSLEKICKACWVHSNPENLPPRSHNLMFILSQTRIELTQEQKEFSLQINQYQIEGRYPEQWSLLYKSVNASMARNIMDEAKQLQKWLLSKVQ